MDEFPVHFQFSVGAGCGERVIAPTLRYLLRLVRRSLVLQRRGFTTFRAGIVVDSPDQEIAARGHLVDDRPDRRRQHHASLHDLKSGLCSCPNRRKRHRRVSYKWRLYKLRSLTIQS